MEIGLVMWREPEAIYHFGTTDIWCFHNMEMLLLERPFKNNAGGAVLYHLRDQCRYL